MQAFNKVFFHLLLTRFACTQFLPDWLTVADISIDDFRTQKSA